MTLASASFMLPVLLRLRLISLSICIHFFVHRPPTTTCLFSTQLANERRERGHMQSIDLEEIKAALWEQASHPCTRVSWGTAQVMAARYSRGQLLVQLRGWRRWTPVEAVTIERATLCPTGACDLEDAW